MYASSLAHLLSFVPKSLIEGPVFSIPLGSLTKRDEGTGVLVSGGSATLADVKLSGNDLRHVGQELAEGAIYIPTGRVAPSVR
jgi:hypothetical protein